MGIANIAGCCCTCPQHLCVTATCTNATGATITVKDASLATVASCVLGKLTDGMAADLDGSAYLYIPGGAGGMQSTNHFYLAFWVNPDSTASLQTIAHKDSEWWVFADGTDLVFQVQTTSGLIYARAAGVLSAGTWTHVMVAYAAFNRSLRVFIDGVLAATTVLPTSFTVTKTWDFPANSEGWSFVLTSDPPDGQDGLTNGAWTGSDGSPASGSLDVESYSLNGTPRVGYWEWSGLWTALGLPASKSIASVRMEAINTRSYGDLSDGLGFSIGPFELYHPAGFLYATFWAGRAVTVEDGAWVSTGAQPDQTIPFALSGTGASIKLRVGVSVHGHNFTQPNGFRFDHLSIVANIAGAATPVVGAGDVFFGLADGTLDGDTASAYAGGFDEMFYGNAPTVAYLAHVATRLYNDGDGLCAALSTTFVSGGIDSGTAVLWGLRAAWALDEASGTREPAIGLDEFGMLEGGGTTGNRAGAVPTCWGAPTCCMEVDPSVPETYTVEAELAGHNAGTAEVTFSDCKNAIAVSIPICPTTYDYSVRVTGCRGFGVPGVGVDISGDQSDSGTTDGDGVATFTFNSQADCSPDALTVTLTPPVGKALHVRDPMVESCPSPGSNPATVPHTDEGNPCGPSGAAECLVPDTGYICGLCAGPYPFPAELDYSDDHGSLTFTYNGLLEVVSPTTGQLIRGGWQATYSYSPASAADCILCWTDGVTDLYAAVKDQGATVFVTVTLLIVSGCRLEVIRDVGVVEACDSCPTMPAMTCTPKSWRLGSPCSGVISTPNATALNRWTGIVTLDPDAFPTVGESISLSRISGHSVPDDAPGNASITG